jgi:hypothetical protein
VTGNPAADESIAKEQQLHEFEPLPEEARPNGLTPKVRCCVGCWVVGLVRWAVAGRLLGHKNGVTKVFPAARHCTSCAEPARGCLGGFNIASALFGAGHCWCCYSIASGLGV